MAWQMSWIEYGQDDVVPVEQHNPHGSIYYRCGVCGDFVGIYGPKGFHERGWLHKKEKCSNGYVVNWKGVQREEYVDGLK